MPTKKFTIEMEEEDFKLARRMAFYADTALYKWAGKAVAKAAIQDAKKLRKKNPIKPIP